MQYIQHSIHAHMKFQDIPVHSNAYRIQYTNILTQYILMHTEFNTQTYLPVHSNACKTYKIQHTNILTILVAG